MHCSLFEKFYRKKLVCGRSAKEHSSEYLLSLYQIKSHSFATILSKTVDFADLGSFFTEAHCFSQSVFGSLPSDFLSILLGSFQNGRLSRHRKPSENLEDFREIAKSLVL